MEKLVIDAVDYDGNRVILTEKKWKQKIRQHSELLDKIFLKNLEDTIKKPHEVWEDYSDKENKRCYYKKYSINSYGISSVLHIFLLKNLIIKLTNPK